MSLAQHKDDRLRFEQQLTNSRNDVIPFIEAHFPLRPGMQVMEIGCGEGGVLQPFLEKGCHCVGVDLVPARIALARSFLGDYEKEGRLRLIAQNIYDVDFHGAFQHAFDLILLKDAIEHIPDQERLIGYLKTLLKPGGQVFFGFPPWYMPHGGHQQICQNRLLSMLPYIHLLPGRLYPALLKTFGEKPDTIHELLDVKSTGISIERFERIVKKQGFRVSSRCHFLINPIYRYKFGLKPRRQAAFITALPWLRDFLTTCVYYLITPAE
ncbi:class I SAM-dependent methyltransferase [Compostibacter hankyongensis]|uniref:Class I SAM-dependent methyltransferase n=1 Tax=Compostibacter hankyongensis TaxID=1007089 RepID=A0ABP8FXF8_9BACT